MDFKEIRHDGVVVLQPAGHLDTRNAFEFEGKVTGLLDSGSKHLVVDFARVELMTSAGLRVLVMLSKRLAGGEGALALCALNEQVRTVFEIAGLGEYFSIFESRAEAIGRLSSETRPSRVGLLAAKLLERSAGMGTAAPVSGSRPNPSAGGPSLLSRQVAHLLSQSSTGSRRQTRSRKRGSR